MYNRVSIQLIDSTRTANVNYKTQSYSENDAILLVTQFWGKSTSSRYALNIWRYHTTIFNNTVLDEIKQFDTVIICIGCNDMKYLFGRDF